MRSSSSGDPEDEEQCIQTKLDEDPPGEHLEDSCSAGREDHVGEGNESEHRLEARVSRALNHMGKAKRTQARFHAILPGTLHPKVVKPKTRRVERPSTARETII